MCIRDSSKTGEVLYGPPPRPLDKIELETRNGEIFAVKREAVSYTHLRAHETVLDLVCRLLLEKKKYVQNKFKIRGKQDTLNNILNNSKHVSR